MNKPTTEQVLDWAQQSEIPKYIRLAAGWREMERFAAKAYAAGLKEAELPRQDANAKASKRLAQEAANAIADLFRVGFCDEQMVSDFADQILRRIEQAVVAEREAIIAQLLALGALEDGDFIAAIRARSAAKEQP